MKDTKLTRRNFLQKAAITGAITLGAGVIVGCKPDQAESKGDAKPADKPAEAKTADACTDVSGLTDAEKATRDGLKYVEKSDDPTKACTECSMYVPGSPCGTCTAFPGPVTAAGTCVAFSKKA